jgi:O-antigen ligase
MAFFLFILLNATLFIRPAEIVPGWEEAPVYLTVFLACLVVAYPRLLVQLTPTALVRQPISACILGLWAMAVLSQAIQLQVGAALDVANTFGKVVLYYFLFVAVIDTPARLRQLLLWLVVFIAVAVVLSDLHWHGYIELPSQTFVMQTEIDRRTGEEIVITRLHGTGIFSDPNDLCLILSFGIIVCLYALGDKRYVALRPLWVVFIVLFAYTMTQTQSRGGLLGLVVGLLILFQARFGWAKAALLSGVAGAALLVLAGGGRQLSFDLSSSDDTGQERIQKWVEGFDELKSQPLFGIGVGAYDDRLGLMAHNSFVHAYVETGLLGGACFVGAFYLAWRTFRRFGREVAAVDPDLGRLRPYLMALVGAYSAGIFSLSRSYVVPTYLIIALVAAYANCAAFATQQPAPRLDANLLRRLTVVGVTSLLGLYLFARLMVRWG